MKKTIGDYLASVLLSFAFLGVLACSSDKETAQNLTVKGLAVNTDKIDFQSAESNAEITINSEATAWLLQISNASWIKLSKVAGTTGTTVVQVTVLENTTLTARTGIITLTSGEAKPLQIKVSQAAGKAVDGTYPSYNTNPLPADATGMSSTAVQLAAKMKLGWNIGNTLEATGGETAWGNPKVTKELIDLVKANGFNAIRIPCSWNQYLANAEKAQIKADWLNRVKEVVQYCVDNDMYVIVNIHWDNGWLENNVTEAKKDANNAKQKAFWEQIATELRGFDEHLLFASANEPNVENATQMAVLTSYHQTFIDAVRSTGGKNAYRNLIVQGPSTDIEKTNKLMTTLPTDKVPNRMMAEVHYYTPYQFALMDKDADWGKMFYYWGKEYHSSTDLTRNATWGEEADLDKFFLSMKTQFVDKGIPVILGEFGAIKRTTLTGDDLTLHLASRAYFLKYVVKQSKANGLIPFYWDAGNLGVNTMSLFDRSNNTVYDAQALNALLDGLK
ncbi:MAG: cellulase family glycosylhydrolase [Flavobacterium nitrogenifigens]|uniref:cellulase family glycosylhydrolase n=1 Tax=Flavobacterium nitrogenifigens TaxID=1617283 RepID=UPI002807EB9F|nr:cellulase family glycosylhydrolase [Flavobacterium nitrogenifigens]MDQ8011006.1 cellulase family glycosylhydrolase [Flavobacterium nitrogenifigens]